jgi:YHS domain-containing protein
MTRLLLYLFNLIFVIFIGWILNRVLRSLFGRPLDRGGSRSAPRGGSTPVIEGQTARDPVCGMFVSTELSHRLTCGKETLHFCSRECLDRYQKNEPKS